MKKLGEKEVYRGYRGILQRQYALPDGKTITYDVVQNGNYVSVAAFTPQREAILVKQFRPGAERVLWSFPEGAIDIGEQPEQAAQRELLEETGFHSSDVSLLSQNYKSYATQQQFCLLATDCRYQQPPQPDEDEILETILLPLSDFRQLLKSGNEPFLNRGLGYQALDRLGWL